MVLRHLAEPIPRQDKQICRRLHSRRPIRTAVAASERGCRRIRRLDNLCRVRRRRMTRRKGILIIFRELGGIDLVNTVAKPLDLINDIYRP